MRPVKSPAATAGASLIEVLVSLVVLSVGLLGAASMLVQSIRNSHSALLRTRAVDAVADMADRIRANARARSAYDTTGYGTPARRGCAPGDPVDTSQNCDSAMLAEDDLARWQEMVQAALPAPQDGADMATVRFTPAAGALPDRYRIRITWCEPGVSKESAANHASHETQLLLWPPQ